MADVDISICAERLIAALGDCVDTLGFEGCQVGETPARPQADHFGAYISLVCDTQAVQVGLAGSHDDCVRIANVMLGIMEGDEPLPNADVEDAVGEFVNVLAGRFKTLLQGVFTQVVPGLPLSIRGKIEAPSGSQISIRRASIGDASMLVTIMQSASRSQSEQASHHSRKAG